MSAPAAPSAVRLPQLHEAPQPLPSKRGGFYKYAVLTFTNNPQQYYLDDMLHQKSRVEKFGDALMWHVVELPRHAYTALHNPKVLVVVFTVLAMLAVQIAFNPGFSLLIAGKVLSCIQAYMSPTVIKALAYISLEAAIAGWCGRALGRLFNTQLMDHFYEKAPNAINRDQL